MSKIDSDDVPVNVSHFDWSKRVSQPVLDLPFIEGVPSPEKAKAMQRWILDHKDRYANKLVKLYHGTDPSLPIEEEGLKPTSATRRRSYQSESGYVYLANTPERAENFGKLGNQGRCAVYEVVVPIRHLRADLDQLNNQRSTGRYGDLGDTVGESIVYGGGVRIKGGLEPWQVRRMEPHELAPSSTQPMPPMTAIKLKTATNPLGWVFAEYEPGKRVTADMVSFDCKREDIQVNAHKVVLFYDMNVARLLLKDFVAPNKPKSKSSPSFGM